MFFGSRLLTRIALLSLFFAFVRPCLAEDISLDDQSRGLAHYIMALCYDNEDQSAKAISEYQKSIKFNPQEALPRLKLGDYYLRLGELDRAQEQLREVLQINPHDSKAHYLLALIYSSQQQYDAAANEYELLLKDSSKDNPTDSDVYLYLGQMYYAQNKYPQAIEQFSRIIALNPKNASAFYLLGSVYADSNEYDKAIEDFCRVLQLDPGNSDGLNSLGYVYTQKDIHLDEAIAMINKAITIDPANGAYYDSLGWAYYKKGMYRASLIALQKAQTLIEDEILYDHLGDVYKAMKEYTQALENWQKSLEKNPHQIAVQQKIEELKKCIASKSIHPQS